MKETLIETKSCEVSAISKALVSSLNLYMTVSSEIVGDSWEPETADFDEVNLWPAVVLFLVKSK